MICAKCGAENRDGSNFCRYCSAQLTQLNQDPTSGYIPSVPPQPAPGAPAASPYYPPPPSYQTPPRPMARQVVPSKMCPRCNSTSVAKGTIPLWAILVAVIGAPFTCLLSLLFLLVKDPNSCLNCGLEFK